MQELSKALASGKDVKLNDNVALDQTLTVAGGILDGGGKTLESEERFMVKVNENGGTIKNLVIDGDNEEGEGKSKRGISNTEKSDYATKDVCIENVQFLNLGYAFNLYAVKSETVNLYMTGCKIQNWSSFAGFDAAFFTNCEFIRGTYYTPDSYFNGGIRPYDDVTFDNCDFAEGFKIVNDKSLSITIKFKNCRYNGELVTQNNVDKLLDEPNSVSTTYTYVFE